MSDPSQPPAPQGGDEAARLLVTQDALNEAYIRGRRDMAAETERAAATQPVEGASPESLNEYAARVLANPEAAIRALGSVVYERYQQDQKWGEQNHGPEVWLAILTEEVGELAQAMLNDRFPGPDHGGGHRAVRMRCEAQQVAAVAVAFIEYLDRTRVGQCAACRGTGLAAGHRPCGSCGGSGDL